jgi:hypothetical protein
MKRCYNYELLWISIFALLLLVVVALQPYRIETFADKIKQLDGEDLNNHSCPKLMNNSVYLKDQYKNFNKNAQLIASLMEPGLSEEYMETESNKHLKGMCIIPDDKIGSYNLFVQEDPIKGGPSQICKATLTNKATNTTTDVVMPYVSDVNSGCALIFSEYANDPKQVETLLGNLQKLSDEYNEHVKQTNTEQKKRQQNQYNSYSSANKQIKQQTQSYQNLNDELSTKQQQTKSELDMTNAINKQLKQTNKQLKVRSVSTW